MSVVGIDFGTQNSRIAVVRSGGVDVICNEVSDRATPSMVSFDRKRRYAGDAARTLQVGNFRNTVCNLPRLVGRLATEPLITQIENNYQTCRLAEKGGVVGGAVSFREEDVVFSNTELVGMFLNKLKSITYAETKQPVSDIVISVPAFFTEKERRMLIDAAEVAGLNCLRTVNDTTAAAVSYGMLKTDISADVPKLVVILDIGYSSLKASIASFTKGSVEIRAHVCDYDLGGRDFDEAMVSHFAEHFKGTRHVDIRENKKALLRLRVACERMKKVLSGIQMTRLDLEALIDGNDFPLEITRQQFEDIAGSLINRVALKLRELLAMSQVTADQIDSVEIIGGSTRIPAIKACILQVFGKEPSTTLNADEAVSRGCALLCAIDSPLVRVRDYKLADIVTYPIKFVGRGVDGKLIGEIEAFTRGSFITETAKYSFEVDQSFQFPFTLEAHYSEQSEMPPGVPTQLAKFTISCPSNACLAGSIIVGFDAVVNSSGVIDITKATAEVSEVSDGGDGEDSGAGDTAEALENVKSPKVKTRTITLSVRAETFRLPRQTIQLMKDAEISMTLHDKLVAEIDDRRNAVEEFIYESRSKLEDVYASISTSEERDSVFGKLLAAEDWLYNEGADVGKDEYMAKLEELRKLLKPYANRLIEQSKIAATPVDDQTSDTVVEKSTNSPSDVSVPEMDMD